MSIKSIIFLKQRVSSLPEVVSGFRNNVEGSIEFNSSGKLLVTGTLNGDYTSPSGSSPAYSQWAALIDLNGNYELNIGVMGGVSQIADAKILPNGDYALLCATRSMSWPAPFFTVARVTPTGTQVWAKQISSGGFDDSLGYTSLAVDSVTGDVVVYAKWSNAELWLAKLEFATGQLIWNVSRDTQSTADGDVVIANLFVVGGDIYATGYWYEIASSQTVCAAWKFNSLGVMQWCQTLNMRPTFNAADAAITPTGELVLLGYTSDGSGDTWRLAKLTNTGAIAFQRSVASADLPSGWFTGHSRYKLALSPDGSIYIAATPHESATNPNTFIAKMTSAGVAVTARVLTNTYNIGAENANRRSALTVSSTGDVFVATGYGEASYDVESAIFRLKGDLLTPTTFTAGSWAPYALSVTNTNSPTFTTTVTTDISLTSRTDTDLGNTKIFTDVTPFVTTTSLAVPVSLYYSPGNSYL